MGLPAYFAGSINGDHWEGQRRAFDGILAAMGDYGLTIISQHGAVNPNAAMESFDDTTIYEIDCAWIDQSKCMIAEGSGASFGVGYEVAYALHERHIPVLVLHRVGERHSAMFSGNKYLRNQLFDGYREYQDQGDISRYVFGFAQYAASRIAAHAR